MAMEYFPLTIYLVSPGTLELRLDSPIRDPLVVLGDLERDNLGNPDPPSFDIFLISQVLLCNCIQSILEGTEKPKYR